LTGTKNMLQEEMIQRAMDEQIFQYENEMDHKAKYLLDSYEALREKYDQDQFTFKIRDKEISMDITTTSLSGLRIPKVQLPHYHDWGDQLTWLMKENVPGSFPYTAGVFPFKRKGEDPTRQFAGEGTPER